MAYTANVRYGKMLLVGTFKTDKEGLRLRDKCVIRTDRGREIGEIISGPHTAAKTEGVPDLLRRATADDLRVAAQLEKENRVRAIQYCKEEIQKLGLKMKLVEVDPLFGGERIIFYFVSETRVDFRELVRRLAHEFRTRIELKQIGARDQARLVGDIGHCGLSLCCRGWIKDLGGITMDMAKVQKHTADPSKITGRCGKLLCCLRYEYSWYIEGRELLPPKGSKIETRIGTGFVVDHNLLLREVTIEKDGNGERKVVKLADIVDAPAAKPGCSGCDKPKQREAERRGDGKPLEDTREMRRIEQDTKILEPAPEPPQFVRVCSITDLPMNSGREFEVKGILVAFFNVDGTVHAVQSDCPHQGGPLADGTLEGTTVTCPWHQWKFDVATGAALSVSGSTLKRFEVRIEGYDVLVKL
jgi:cell fate regulator YaaT (PSP1 superfamily)/nitrite reductase/ring-hydroxylating ferredoxin subunit